jgi:hypothetical protein
MGEATMTNTTENLPRLVTEEQPDVATVIDPGKAPTGPPTPMRRDIPGWFKPAHDYLAQVIADESLVMDLCLERAIQIVEFNHNAGLVGIDHFIESATPPRTQMVAFAIPVATELYKQVLASISRDSAKFEALIAECVAKRDAKIELATR